jgi:hypothetical protein
MFKSSSLSYIIWVFSSRSLSFCSQIEILGLDCSQVSPAVLMSVLLLPNLRVLKVELSKISFKPNDVTQFLAMQNQVRKIYSLMKTKSTYR